MSIIRRNKKRVNPSISFELVNNNQLKVTTEWEPGQDISLFGQLLTHLNGGKLSNAIVISVVNYAGSIGEVEKTGFVKSLLQSDDPVICPTQAIRLNSRSFHG